MMVKKIFFILWIFIFSQIFLFDANLRGENISVEIQPDVDKNENDSAKIIPEPANAKEKTGIYVFIGWIWMVIFILFYLIRQKIKELDRLYNMNFFSDLTVRSD